MPLPLSTTMTCANAYYVLISQYARNDVVPVMDMDNQALTIVRLEIPHDFKDKMG